MIEHTYQVLEYRRLLNILSQYASCVLGESDCLSLKPSNNLEFIDNELRLVSEMGLLLKVKGFVIFSDLVDILPFLKKSSVAGAILEPAELLSILSLLEACRQATRRLKSNRALCPRLYEMAGGWRNHDDLMNALKAAISLSGLIRDSASLLLKKIRGKKVRQRLDLQRKLGNIQKTTGMSGDSQDSLVTVRESRYVIPVRVDQKSRIEGIVHDYSQTRATCFIEPIQVIQDNNRLAELARDERAEELNILAGLTAMVREAAVGLEASQSLVTRLDGLYARAKFGEALSCVAPEMVETYGVELRGARNPILVALALDSGDKGEKGGLPVPVDIVLTDQERVLIISGPNRGGKTVTLKTLGLMSLMAQAGIPVPAAEGSSLGVFREIMADIGDDQDMQTGLSTFSAHAEHLKYMVEHAQNGSLAIIDEPGMGTDPDEGVALAMAVLDSLFHKGVYAAVSTHSNRLKAYGLLNKGVANASVEFNDERSCPTFELTYGSPGISHALEMARSIGMPQEILTRARAYLDQDEVELNRLIEKLNRLIAKADQEKLEAERAKNRYRDASEKARNRLITLEAEKNALIEAKRLEAEAAIGEAREELKQAINLFKNKKVSGQAYVTEKYAEVGARLMNRFKAANRDNPFVEHEEIKEDQTVFHKKLKQKGVVQRVVPSAGSAQILLGKVRMSARIEDLEVVKGDRASGFQKSGTVVSWFSRGRSPRELDVIGFRVNDALPLIDKTMDRALVDGELKFRIIHGFGTGALREAIRTHLRGVPFVKSVHSADPKSGGDAITVVELS